jgi:hypothetical protein
MTERTAFDPRTGLLPALLIGICAAGLALTRSRASRSCFVVNGYSSAGRGDD